LQLLITALILTDYLVLELRIMAPMTRIFIEIFLLMDHILPSKTEAIFIQT